MGYVNQVLGGKDGSTVLRRLGEAGVSGFILADLTPDEGAELEAEAARFGIGIVYLVAPTTAPVEIGGPTWPSTAPASCTRSRWPA